MAVETGLMTLHEDELKGILQMLAQIARTSEASGQNWTRSLSNRGFPRCRAARASPSARRFRLWRRRRLRNLPTNRRC